MVHVILKTTVLGEAENRKFSFFFQKRGFMNNELTWEREYLYPGENYYDSTYSYGYVPFKTIYKRSQTTMK